MENGYIPFDESGSMSAKPIPDGVLETLRKKLIASFTKGAADSSNNKIPHTEAKPEEPAVNLMFGNSGFGKSEYIKRMTEQLLKTDSRNNNNSPIFIDDTPPKQTFISPDKLADFDWKFDAINKAVNEAKKDAALDLKKLEEATKALENILDQRFSTGTFAMPALDESFMLQAARRELKKSGASGDLLEIVDEVIREKIANKEYSPNGGIRPIAKDVNGMVQNPQAFAAVASRIAVREREREYTRVRKERHETSRATGHALASGFSSGVSAKVRALKPPSFKPRGSK